MGMFDSLYEGDATDYDHEWQTKAYDCNLDAYHVGDPMPDILGRWQGPKCAAPDDYQVEVLGGRARRGESVDSFATIRGGVLATVPADRDPRLPLVNYSGHVIEDGAR